MPADRHPLRPRPSTPMSRTVEPRRRPVAPIASRVAGLLALALTAALAPGCDRSEDASTSPRSTSPRSTSTASADAHPTAPDAAPRNQTVASSQPAVDTRWLDLVDGSRGRSLHTLVHAPIPPRGEPERLGGGAATSAVGGVQPRPPAYPLVVMAHGFRLPADGYERLLQAVARRGYVVAAPDLPHTSAHGGDGDRTDLVNQPADLSFVVDQVRASSARGADGLPPIDGDALAVMGHSDGGLTAAALAYNDGFRDPRVRAAVVLTGGMALFPGSWFTGPAPPLLAVHGTADTTNPPEASSRLVSSLPPGVPGYLLWVEGGDHLGPFMFDTGREDIAAVIADFLDATIGTGERDEARARLDRDASAPGLRLEKTG